MDTQKKMNFLITVSYWAVVILGVYLGMEYLLPVSMPALLGAAIAWLVVRISRKVRCTHRVFRVLLSLVIYGILGLLVVLLSAKGVSAAAKFIKWLPAVYEYKLQPFVTQVYNWCLQAVQMLDPSVAGVLEMVLESVLSALKNLISYLSGAVVDLASGLATGVPNLILSILTMIFSTVFVAGDYEGIGAFLAQHIPENAKRILLRVRVYLTDTLLVVIRSYVLIMLLTFAELAILFSLFGIENPVLKAVLIAVMDILPILGTGGIMIPWAVITLVVGNIRFGLKLLLIYGIVTVVRNYVEPKIVGAQLGLHPIVSLVSMFIGVRLFGIWGLFGLPVGISFLWKERKEKEEKCA